MGGAEVQVCLMWCELLYASAAAAAAAAAHRRTSQRDLQFLITTLQHVAAAGLTVCCILLEMRDEGWGGVGGILIPPQFSPFSEEISHACVLNVFLLLSSPMCCT